MSLGKAAASVSKTDVERYVRKAATSKVREEMAACMEAASTKAERQDCKDTTAKNALATAMGKDAAKVSGTAVEEFVQKAGEAEVATEISACVEVSSSEDQKKICRAAAKPSLARVLGRQEVTNADLSYHILMASRNEVRGEMLSCMTVAGNSSAKMKACKDNEAKAAIASTQGTVPEKVSDTIVEEFSAAAAATALSSELTACSDAGNTGAFCTSSVRRSASTKAYELRKLVAATLGQSVSNVSDTDVNIYKQRGSQNAVGSQMSACSKAAASSAAKQNCTQGAKQAFAQAAGKATEAVMPSDVQYQVNMAAKDIVRTRMSSCVDSTIDDSQRSSCATGPTKEGLQHALAVNTLSNVVVKQYVQSAAAIQVVFPSASEC